MGYHDSGAVGGIFAGFFALYLLIMLGSVILSVAMYVCNSLGIYTIAQRREIKNPWLAWLPVANLWTLGSISDQYQYVTNGKVRNRRKVLVGLSIAVAVLYIIFWICYFGFIVNLAINAEKMDFMSDAQVGEMMLSSLAPMLISLLAMLVVSIVLTVYQYIAYHDLYASCKPQYAGLFTVLSILVNVTLPFFVFACRKHDDGMPPKKSEVQQLPLAEAPAQAQPAEEPAEAVVEEESFAQAEREAEQAE